MASPRTTEFHDERLIVALEILSDLELDDLDFGVIGFNQAGMVRRYNAFESTAAGLPGHRVLGYPFFTAVAPCMNNYLVAQRFEDALADGTWLDDTIQYVLTLRMRPVSVRLRLLAAVGVPTRYVAVLRTH